MLTLEIDIESPWPESTDWEALAARAAGALSVVAPELAKECLSTSMIFTSDAEVQVLNAEWRGRTSRPTCSPFPC